MSAFMFLVIQQHSAPTAFFYCAGSSASLVPKSDLKPVIWASRPKHPFLRSKPVLQTSTDPLLGLSLVLAKKLSPPPALWRWIVTFRWKRWCRFLLLVIKHSCYGMCLLGCLTIKLENLLHIFFPIYVCFLIQWLLSAIHFPLVEVSKQFCVLSFVNMKLQLKLADVKKYFL